MLRTTLIFLLTAQLKSERAINFQITLWGFKFLRISRGGVEGVCNEQKLSAANNPAEVRWHSVSGTSLLIQVLSVRAR